MKQIVGIKTLFLSREDMRAVGTLESTIAADHHETGLLGRRDDSQVLNNHREAEMRLQS